MHYKKYYLRDLSKTFSNSDAYFEYYSLYLDDYKKEYARPGLLILPGGGYGYCSAREAEPIALRFLTEGFTCFVMHYTCNTPYPVPQMEVVFAMDYVKEHCSDFNMLDLNVSLIGFSAGGHLAGSIGIKYKEISEKLNIGTTSTKPLSLIIGYGVISSAENNTHSLTFDRISGGNKELAEELSIEKHITSDFPPTYLFTTKTDQVVPYQNTTILAEKLDEMHIPCKCHLFEKGIHGGSLYSRGVYHEYGEAQLEAEENSIWVKEASEFVFNLIYR